MARLQSIPTTRRSLAAAVVHKTPIGGSNGTRALDTVEDPDLEVTEIASCGGEMLKICGRRDPFCLRRDGTCRGSDGLLLVRHQMHEERGNCRGRSSSLYEIMQIATSAVRECRVVLCQGGAPSLLPPNLLLRGKERWLSVAFLRFRQRNSCTTVPQRQ